jgi:hypothetical protein
MIPQLNDGDLLQRANIVADLCEDLRQGYDPSQRITSELLALRDRIRSCSDHDELIFLHRLHRTLCRMRPRRLELLAA